MERLTNENVKEFGMYQLAHNHVFVKDGEAWYRDFDREVSARDLAKEMFARNGIEYPMDTDEFDEFMLDTLQDGYETIDGMIAMYYLSLWSMADVRESLKYYEDAEEKGLLFDVTKQHDLDGTKRIVKCLIENYTGVPVPVEMIEAAVDILVM
jgi:hypothetical protein